MGSEMCIRDSCNTVAMLLREDVSFTSDMLYLFKMNAGEGQIEAFSDVYLKKKVIYLRFPKSCILPEKVTKYLNNAINIGNLNIYFCRRY